MFLLDEKKVKVVKKMVEVNFTGKELLNNEIFDTTIENVAKENNIYNKDRKYHSLIITLGEKELHAKIEEELGKMKVGEERVVSLTPSEAFGERKADLVRVVPIKVFQEQKINPVPGLMINLGNAIAKVQSVSGGRVRIDLNNPLAGRDLEYTIKLIKEITTKKEIGGKLFEKYYERIPGSTKTISEDKIEITLPKETLAGLEKVNTAIINLAKELGVTLVISPGKEVKKTSETKKEEKK